MADDQSKSRKPRFLRPNDATEPGDSDLVHPTTLLEQNNNILYMQDIGKQYQLIIKDFQIATRDGRIRAKDKQIAEITAELEEKDTRLSTALLRQAELRQNVNQLSLVNDYQAADIKTLMEIAPANKALAKDHDTRLRILANELESKKAYISYLKNGSLLMSLLTRFNAIADPYEVPSRSNIFPFMRLPSEIRNLIYQKSFISHCAIDIWPTVNVAGSPSRARLVSHSLPSGTVALLRASRQVHSEAIGVLYACNQFRFSDRGGWTLLEAWLTSIGSNCRFLTHVSVVCPEWCYSDYQRDTPFHEDRVRAWREMQPVLVRFHAGLERPVGPSLQPTVAFHHASTILLRLPHLKHFAVVVPYNARLLPHSLEYMANLLNSKEASLLPHGGKPATDARLKQRVVFLRRPVAAAQFVRLFDMDDDVRMGRSNVIVRASVTGTAIASGAYGTVADGVSYHVDGGEEGCDEYVYVQEQEWGGSFLVWLLWVVMKCLGY